MGFDQEQQTEIGCIVAKLLGVPEGKTLADFLGETTDERINKILNGYDKGQKKSREDLSKQVTDIAAAIKALGEKKIDDDDDGSDPNAPLDMQKLSPAVRARFEAQEKAAKKLADDLDKMNKAREADAAERAKMEAEAANRSLIDAVKTTALGKKVGVDPESLDFLVAYIQQNGLVKQNDAKTGYVFQLGEDKITGEPLFHPLEDGLAKFVGAGPGARFKPPVQGGGNPNLPNGGGDGGGSGGGISFEKLSQMKPSEIEAAAAAGKLQIGSE